MEGDHSEFTEKGAYAQTELRLQFLDSSCSSGGDIHQFLDGLRTKQEELASVGVDIDEKDYRSTIIKSLPNSLANFASNQLASAKLWSPMKTIDPDVLISVISEEWERQKAKYSRRLVKEAGHDEAMAAVGGTRPSSNGRRFPPRPTANRPPRACWNCGSMEHLKRRCPQPLKTSGGLTKPTTHSAHVAEDLDSDDGAFAVSELESSCDEGSLPELLSVESSSSGIAEDRADADDEGSDEDWFSEIGDDEGCLGHGWDFGNTNLEITAANNDTAAGVSSEHLESPITELYDSGTTQHISPYRDSFVSLSIIPPKHFTAANKQSFAATGIGEMVIQVPNGLDVSKLRLTEVLFSPDVGYTLVSIGRLDENSFSATFANGLCTIVDPDGDVVGQIPRSTKGLYHVTHDHADLAQAATEPITIMELHRRMGHIAPAIAHRLAEKGLVSGLKLDISSGEPTFCEACVYAKATRKPVAKVHQGERAVEFAGEVHTDLWGPVPVATLRGRTYYVSFTDDKTRLTNLYLLQCKSDAFSAYKEYEAWCGTQHGAKVKVLHSDRGGEYLGKEFALHLKNAGTAQKLTVHDTLQHNGVAERLNRTLVEKVRAMLHDSGLPRFLWGEAISHAVYLKNRTPTKALPDDTTPYEAVTGKKPDLRHLRVWGSKVWVRVEAGDKLGNHVKEGRWIGIDASSENRCRVYWPLERKVSVE